MERSSGLSSTHTTTTTAPRVASQSKALPSRASEVRAILLLLFVTDLLLCWLALHLAGLSVVHNLAALDQDALLRDRLVALAVFAVAALLTGSYSTWRITDAFDSPYFVFMAVLSAVVALLALATLLPADFRVMSRREIVGGFVLAAIMLTAWRYAAAHILTRFQSLHRFFYVIGSETEGKRIAGIIRDEAGVLAHAVFVTPKALERKAGHGNKEFASLDADGIVVLEREESHRLTEVLACCETHCRRTFLHPSINDALLFKYQNLLQVAGIPLIEVATFPLRSPYLTVKRWIDIGVAALGLLLALPICVITAIAVALTSPGGVFYSQERIGMGHRPFRIYKFRSMRADVELKDDAGHVLAQENDPRITPVGRFIRKHRIDEIPQLFNVLKGDMSLIGPRPVWGEFYDINRPELPLIDRRLMVRPGLTSLSHVFGGYDSEPADRLRYDLVYISTMSLLTDLKILVATIRIVLSGKGSK